MTKSPHLVIFIKSTSRKGKVPISKLVTRKGKTFKQVFWVNAADVKKPPEKKVMNGKDSFKERLSKEKDPYKKKLLQGVHKLLKDNDLYHNESIEKVALRGFTPDYYGYEVNINKEIKTRVGILQKLISSGRYPIAVYLSGNDESLGIRDLDYFVSMISSSMEDIAKQGINISLYQYTSWLNKYNLEADALASDFEKGASKDNYDDGIDGKTVFTIAVSENRDPQEVYNEFEKMIPEERRLRKEMFEEYKKLPIEKREKMLKENPVKKSIKFGDGINETYKVIKEGDPEITGLWKPASGEDQGLRKSVRPGTYYLRERFSYDIAKAMGSRLIPPTVITEVDGEEGSMQEFEYGCISFADSSYDIRKKVSQEDKSEASLLDFILGNTDRHTGNSMIDKETGQLVLIDHGLCLPDNNAQLRFLESGFYTDGEIPESVLDRFNNANFDDVITKMLRAGFEHAAHLLEERIQYIRDAQYVPEDWEVQNLVQDDIYMSDVMSDDESYSEY